VMLVLGELDHLAGVVHGPEREDPVTHRSAGRVQAIHRGKERVASGGDDQDIVGNHPAIGREDGFAVFIYAVHADPGVQGDVVFLVPRQGVEEDVGIAFLAGQHMAEHDAVVVSVRFIAENGDVESVPAAAGQDLLHRTCAGHAVPDDHQLPGHQCSTMPRSTTTEPRTPAGAAMYNSIIEPPSISSTTLNGTCTSPLAPMGKYRIGTPSRMRTTAMSSELELPPRKKSAWFPPRPG